MKRRHRPIVTPFQVAVLVLSSAPAAPYFLPLGLLPLNLGILDRVRLSITPLPPWRPTDVLIRAPYRRGFWRGIHKALQIPTAPGSCTWSIALGLS